MVVRVRFAFFLPVCLLIGACAELRYIEADFDGVYQSLYPPKTVDKPTPVDQHIKVLLLHGFGEHCIGHAERKIDLLTKGLGWNEQTNSLTEETAEMWNEVQNNCHSRSGQPPPKGIFKLQKKLCEALPNCKVIISRKIGSSSDKKKPFEYGYLRIRELKPKNTPGPKLTFYELTWDPTTRGPEFALLGYDWSEIHHNRRVSINREIKMNVINLGFGDSVLYLGRYKPIIQVPIFTALCAMVMVDNEGKKPCDVSKFPHEPWDTFEFLDKTKFVIISESLGSFFAFDAMTQIGHLEEPPQPALYDEAYKSAIEKLRERQTRFIYEESGVTREKDPLPPDADEEQIQAEKKKVTSNIRKAEAVAAFAYRATKQVFMLANQIPLLHLSQIGEPSAVISERCAPADKITGPAPNEDGLLDRARALRNMAGDKIKSYVQDRLLFDADPNKPEDAERTGRILKNFIERFEAQEEKATPPVTVAISDPNDVFSYSTEDCHVRQNWFGPVHDVLTNLTPSWFGLYADLIEAHTGHLGSSFVRKLLLCGGNKGDPGTAKSCPDL